MWQVTGSYVAGSICPLALLYMLFKYKTKINIKDKVVLITGSTSGLGKACAFAFHEAGCHVILAGRSLEKLYALQQEMIFTSKLQTKHLPAIVVLDLQDDDSVISAAEVAFNIHNKIDILINNAGISHRGSILDTTLDVHKRVMQVNYFGQVALTKAILPKMKRDGGGHIVGISSIQGKISIPYRSAYAASKHAFQAFCDCLRAECVDDNIKVSVISPAYIQTNLSVNAVKSDGSRYGVMDKTTQNGMKPEYVAKKIIEAIMFQNNEVMLSTLIPKIVCYIRTIAPAIFFWLMNSRARKSKSEYR